MAPPDLPRCRLLKTSRAAVIIPAAGRGSRTGLRTPKAFLALHGAPLLAWTIGVFQRHPAVGLVQPVLPAPLLGRFERLRARYGWGKCLPPVAGGRERQDSVLLGLLALPALPSLVVIHDAARPLVSPALVSRVIEEARRRGAAIAAVPVPDTVKRAARRGCVASTVDRRGLWLAQTPQAFRSGLIMEAHRRAAAEGFRGTDDASLVERLGRPVSLVPGSSLNLKVTTREDLALARRLLRPR